MKMNTNKQADTAQSSVNIIGTGTTIVGELRSNGDVRIDGSIKGAVHSKAKVVLGVTGVIEGDTICQNADFSGTVQGKVEVSEMLFLKSTAKIMGDIIASKLVVESGAIFTGNCSMGPLSKEINGSKKTELNNERQALKTA